jgi:hypothetical protein
MAHQMNTDYVFVQRLTAQGIVIRGHPLKSGCSATASNRERLAPLANETAPGSGRYPTDRSSPAD